MSNYRNKDTTRRLHYNGHGWTDKVRDGRTATNGGTGGDARNYRDGRDVQMDNVRVAGQRAIP